MHWYVIESATEARAGAPWNCDDPYGRRGQMKGAQKPKKLQKKVAQKTLKQRRVEKRAADKQGRSSSL